MGLFSKKSDAAKEAQKRAEAQQKADAKAAKEAAKQQKKGGGGGGGGAGAAAGSSLVLKNKPSPGKAPAPARPASIAADVHSPAQCHVVLTAFAPRHEDELELTPGDMIYVTETPQGGWWFGSKPGGAPPGWFPANHVSTAPVDLVPKPRPSMSRLDSFTSAAAAAAVVAAASPQVAKTGKMAKAEGIYDEFPSLGLYEEIAFLQTDGGDAGAASASAPASAPAPTASSPPQPAGVTRVVADGPTINRTEAVLEPEVTQASWFVSGLPRDQVRWWANQLKMHGPIGGFLVREPESQTDAYALVFKEGEDKLKNYLIKCAPSGFRLGTMHAPRFMDIINALGMDSQLSPLPVPLLPGFYLNKGAFMRKALKEGKTVPGMTMDEMRALAAQKAPGAVTSPAAPATPSSGRDVRPSVGEHPRAQDSLAAVASGKSSGKPPARADITRVEEGPKLALQEQLQEQQALRAESLRQKQLEDQAAQQAAQQAREAEQLRQRQAEQKEREEALRQKREQEKRDAELRKQQKLQLELEQQREQQEREQRERQREEAIRLKQQEERDAEIRMLQAQAQAASFQLPPPVLPSDSFTASPPDFSFVPPPPADFSFVPPPPIFDDDSAPFVLPFIPPPPELETSPAIVVDWSPYEDAAPILTGLFVITECSLPGFLALREGDKVDILEYADDESSVVCRTADNVIGLYMRNALATEDEIVEQARHEQQLAAAAAAAKNLAAPAAPVDFQREYGNASPVEAGLVVVGVSSIAGFLPLDEGTYVDVLEYLDPATVICRTETGAIGPFERGKLKSEQEIYQEFKQEVLHGDAQTATDIVRRHSRTISLYTDETVGLLSQLESMLEGSSSDPTQKKFIAGLRSSMSETDDFPDPPPPVLFAHHPVAAASTSPGKRTPSRAPGLSTFDEHPASSDPTSIPSAPATAKSSGGSNKPPVAAKPPRLSSASSAGPAAASAKLATAAVAQSPPPASLLPPPPPPEPQLEALYDHQADASAASLLSFHKGDIMLLIAHRADGWSRVELRGVEGWVPTSYTREVPAHGSQHNLQGGVSLRRGSAYDDTAA